MIAILGAGGHARVLARILDHQRAYYRMLEATDEKHVRSEEDVVIGVGGMKVRRKLYEKFNPTRNVIDHTAIFCRNSHIGHLGAVQIMAGAVIQAGVIIHANTIINTRATIDHDCIIGPHCHVAPGAILCGGVELGGGCFIGAGAIIVEGVKVDAGTFIPAGSLLAGPRDLRRPTKVVWHDRAGEAVDSAGHGADRPADEERSDQRDSADVQSVRSASVAGIAENH